MQRQGIWPDVKRAWVLVQAEKEDLGAVANDILKLNVGWRDAYNGVIRADLVEGDYNIVVSLYARDGGQLAHIEERINGVEGVAAAVSLPVQGHFPPATHDTHGYISDYEAELVDPAAGPQGFNAWG
jgi:hypothetical protein